MSRNWFKLRGKVVSSDEKANGDLQPNIDPPLSPSSTHNPNDTTRARPEIGFSRAISTRFIPQPKAGNIVCAPQWAKFKAATNRELANAAAKEFIEVYDPQYDMWAQNESRMVDHTEVPTLDSDTTKHVIILLNRYVLELSKLLTEGSMNTSSVAPPEGLHCLCLLDLLSRSKDNAKLFVQYDFLTHPMQVAKLATWKLFSLVNTEADTGNTELKVWWKYLHVVLAYCMQIVARFTGSRDKPGVDECDASATLLRLNITRIIKDNMRVVKAVKEQNAYRFAVLLLETLHSVVSNNPQAKEKVRETDLLDTLADWLGWPQHNLSTTLQEEYTLQLLVLNVLSDCVDNDAANSARLSELGGYERIMDMILWVAESFGTPDNNISTDKFALMEEQNTETLAEFASTFAPGKKKVLIPRQIFRSHSKLQSFSSTCDTNPLFPPDPVPRSRIEELDKLFGILFKMCVGATDKRVVSNRFVLSVLLEGLFNEHIHQTRDNTRVRLWVRTIYPELQFVVLEFLSRLIYEYPASLELCRKYRVWDTLFGIFFFGSYAHFVTKREEPNMDNDARRRWFYLFNQLHTCVLDLVQFVATMQDCDNAMECEILLDLLESYQNNPWVVLHACESLTIVMSHNPTQTLRALQQLPAFSTLCLLIDSHVVHKSANSEMIRAPLFNEAHCAVLGVLSLVLSKNEAIANIALQNANLANTLFDLLRFEDSKKLALAQLVSLLRTPPNDVENFDLYRLCGTYINYMARLQEDTPISALAPLPEEYRFNLLLDMLQGIQRVASDGQPQQRMFREVDAFVRIVNLINVEVRPTRRAKLCEEVLRTVSVLIINYARNKEYFRSNIGYDQLKNLILHAELNSPSRNTLKILCDMLVDGFIPNDISSHRSSNRFHITQYTIGNPDIVTLLFNLFPYFAPELQIQLLDTFTRLVDENTLNRSMACNCNLVYLLLDPRVMSSQRDVVVIEKTVKLVEILATHSFTVRELKRFFGLLKSETGDFRPALASVLLPALQNMALRRSNGPMVFFDFSGIGSGLTLPSFEKWPFSRGITFCTWLRVESFADPLGKPKYEPRLISLMTETGIGYEIYFAQGCIQVHSLSSSGAKVAFTIDPQSTQTANFVFKPRTWYHVAVTHSNSRFSQSEVRLYVDGVMKQKASLKFQQINNLVSSHIGTNADAQAPARSMHRVHAFYGQMGTIYLFDDALSSNQLSGIYSLGPNYSGSFQESGKEVGASSPSTDASLTSKLVVNYNSRALERAVVLDNTPDRSVELSLDATLLGGNACITRDIKDTIHCLGGIKVLFPLFAQLSQPLVPTGTQQDIDYSPDAGLTATVLAVLRDMLGGAQSNQEDMIRCKGFSVISFLLLQIPPRSRDSRTVDVLAQLAQLPSLPPTLKEEVIVQLLLDFRLWIYTGHEVQTFLLRLILTMMHESPDYFRALFTVQKIVDTLRFFYWLSLSPKIPASILGLYQATQPVFHPITKEMIGSRPETAEILKLRRIVFDILRVSLKYASTSVNTIAQDVQVLCNAVVDYSTIDPRELSEILAFLEEILIYSSMLDHVLDVGGTDVFILVLKHEDEGVRIWCLRLLTKLHSLCISKLTGSSTRVAKKKPKPVKDSALILRALAPYPFSEPIYNGLFGLLLGVDFDTAQRARANYSTDMEIKIPEMLATILKLLSGAETPLRHRVLQDLCKLLSSKQNLATLLHSTRVGWQGWFLPIYADNSDSRFSAEHESVQNLILDILKAAVIHGFQENKQGYIWLEQTLTFLQHLSNEGGVITPSPSSTPQVQRKESTNIIPRGNVLSAEVVTRLLFTKILSGIKTDVKLVLHDASSWKPSNRKALSPLVRNVVYLLGLVEERFNLKIDTEILHEPTSLENAKWEDAALVKDALHILDAVHIIGPALAVTDTRGSNSVLMVGAMPRIALKFALLCLNESSKNDDVTACVDAIVQIRDIIHPDLRSNTPSSPRLLFAMFHSLRILRSVLEREAVGVAKSIVPLVKDLLRRCRNDMVQYLVDREIRSAISAVTSNTTHMTPDQQDNSDRYVTVENDVKAWITDISECTIPDFCASLNWSFRWNLIEEYAEAALKNLEVEEKILRDIIEKRRTKCKKDFAQALEKEEEAISAVEGKGDEDLAHIQQTCLHGEVERKASMIVSMKESTQLAAYQWRATLRSLTNERGPWGTTEAVLHWKLDKTENFSRMRLKLKRNYKFNDHRGCALTSKRNTIELPPIEQESDTPTPLLLSGVKLTALGDDSIPEEDGDADATNVDNTDRAIFDTRCEWVTPMVVRQGTLQITSTHILFIEDRDSTPATTTSYKKDKKWPLEHLREVHLRRYLLRRSALEIFLVDQTNYFLNFPKKDRNKVYNKIFSLRPPNLTYLESRSPEEIFKKSGLTREWQLGKLSNFDYLMYINTIAGRTYNDLMQYPIFPWIIQDYTSPTLDLQNPATFRDLSKPIGALTTDRLKFFQERFTLFDDPNIPKFHYGSHYSSAGITLFYLVRMEPFTTLFLKLQGGKFDHADRMFDSIPTTWKNCLTSTSDVKELIPEFFYTSEFLINSNNFNFGTKQNGQLLGDVKLPPWAATPEDFVRLHREALESEYVSAHLHEWIDLVFGFKQKGKYAIEANNVFYYLTYENAVDIDAIKDPTVRRATEAQIDNFGQTPAQLIKKKSHPTRNMPLPRSLSAFDNFDTLQAYYLQVAKGAVVFIGNPDASDKIITVDKSRIASCHRWLSNTASSGPGGPQAHPFTFELDAAMSARRRVCIPFASDFFVNPSCFVVVNDGRVLISCGHWDNSFKITWIETSKQLQTISKHKDIVTCIALSTDGRTLVTGSRDTTLIVWDVFVKGNTCRVDETPLHILYGHDDEVTCVAVNVELDLAVSGSRDGSCIVHSLRRGEYVRSIFLPKASPVSMIAVSSTGNIILYSSEDLVLYLYSINGKLLKSMDEHERLTHMIISRNADYLVTGGERGTIIIRTLYNLKFAHKFAVESMVCSLSLSRDEKNLLVGLEDGKLLIITRSPSTS